MPERKPLTGLPRKLGRVTILSVVSPTAPLKVQVKCGVCKRTPTLTYRILHNRFVKMGPDTDCGCSSRQEKVVVQDAHDLTGKQINNWIVVRLATPKEASTVASAGRVWIVKCQCGNPEVYARTTAAISKKGSSHCKHCQRRRAPKYGHGSGVNSKKEQHRAYLANRKGVIC